MTASMIAKLSGNSCVSLASECDISNAEFYNNELRSNSMLSPNGDGTCYTYFVIPGDDCSDLAETYTITIDQIESYNTDTWGWLGCGDLQAGQNICLSSGNPPFPAPVNNTECGPQVPGTFEPSDGTDWALLNPCPLNACCDIWGQCGITPEFCTISNSATGAPGTAAVGSNGCISNCGIDIVTSTPPGVYASMAFFEGFNSERPCLRMDAYDIDTASYTHVLYAFGNITSDYAVNNGGYTTQFNEFLQLPNVQRIITFGGWDFSTDPSTYMIFREGVTASNRDLLAQNVANFLIENGLDGVDFDWEYPGAPDIPGIPAASPDDGANYLEFLKVLRALLPTEKTISIAAPSSYWYLQHFPIQQIAEVVDFIIYMTYDLQGVWDLGKNNQESGCALGNCLRSDVNLTETEYALSMITKAGVPSSQVIVGVTSYGRSFTMASPGCVGPDCTYIAAGSAGECTQTVGYLGNAEINEIIATNPTAQSLTDTSSDTDILVYNSTQWVGYMSSETKTIRTAVYQGWSMGGIVDWAIDLQAFGSSRLAPSCVAGTGLNSSLTDLCTYACQYDFCPTNACNCTGTGNTVSPPDATYSEGYPAQGVDGEIYGDLCNFACSRGYCPATYCTWNPPPTTVVFTVGSLTPTNIVTYRPTNT